MALEKPKRRATAINSIKNRGPKSEQQKQYQLIHIDVDESIHRFLTRNHPVITTVDLLCAFPDTGIVSVEHLHHISLSIHKDYGITNR
jgi:hypothetical protein